MKTTKIVIASILKPVNDVRMYKKFAKSLTQDPFIEAHIVGFRVASHPEEERIFFHPLYNFSRLSLKRLFAPLKFLNFLISNKPDIVIISTHELLLPAALYKLIFKKTLLYDVQENYFNNINYTSAFPPLFRSIIAFYVRFKELITRPLFNHYLLAEKCYTQELKFTQDKYTIIENKYVGSLSNHKKRDFKETINLLYSGTIADNYGVFEAITLTDELHKLDPRICLMIIGFTSKQGTFNEVKKAITSKDYIRMIGGDTLVAHDQILKEINNADFGFISYRNDKSTKDCIPTKLYEYLANHLPIILFPNPLWESICKEYNAAVIVNPLSYSASQLIKDLESFNFYTSPVDESVLWIQEEKKLKEVIERFRK